MILDSLKIRYLGQVPGTLNVPGTSGHLTTSLVNVHNKSKEPV